ncbi:MAG TPA: tetratricopeptide repeat protein, partial [Ktedonobacterales bacterium]|nr:tetratricopeptide repeat protein [Ktedonobacterales bacterium]
ADAVRELDRSTLRPASLLVLGQLDLAMGNGEAAASGLAEAIRWAIATGSEFYLVNCQTLLAERDLLAGHPEAARQRLEPLPDLTDAEVTLVLPVLAWAYRDQGELDRAEAFARQTAVLATRREHRMALVEALRISALVALRQGRHREAAIALDEALTLAAPFPYAEAKTLYVYGQVHEATGDPKRAREAYQQALAICARLGERLYAEHIERALAGL